MLHRGLPKRGYTPSARNGSRAARSVATSCALSGDSVLPCQVLRVHLVKCNKPTACYDNYSYLERHHDTGG